MSFNKEEFDRKVIPIWDGSKTAASLVENTSSKEACHAILGKRATPRLLAELLESRNIGTAVELLNTAKLEQHSEGIITASRRIIEDGDLPKPVLAMARVALSFESDCSKGDLSNHIAELRANLRINPKNTLAWVDLAREYLIIGLAKPAERAMSVALGLAQGHRWVTRVASRLYVHLDKLEKSYYILSKHPAIKVDPWIASAELAVSQIMGKSSRNLGFAKRLLDQGLHPSHTVELASSMGTLELESGAIKRAKVYIRASLLYPNRNSLAQAMWAEQAHDIKAASYSIVQALESAYEAKAWESYIRGDIYGAMQNCQLWYESEPYSSKPPMLATYLSALDDRYDEIITIAKKGLITNPDNVTLKLNRAYAEIAKLDPTNLVGLDSRKVRSWISLFQEAMKRDRYHVAHALANMGMLCYRVGEHEKGKEYYERAERHCIELGYDTQIMCNVYHAREALIASTDWASSTLEKARAISSKSADPSKPAADYYLDKLKRLQQDTANYRAIFKIESSAIESQGHWQGRLDFGNAINSGLSFFLPDDFK